MPTPKTAWLAGAILGALVEMALVGCDAAPREPGATKHDGVAGAAPSGVPVVDAGCGSPCGSAPSTDKRDAGSVGSAPVDAGSRDAAAQGPVLDAGLPDAGSLDGMLGPNGRPVGVALCYTARSASDPATTHFWDALRTGDFEGRAVAIDELTAAAAAYPEEEEFALLLGLASLWRVAEPLELESLNPLLTLDSITTAESELERAYALCPTDHRIPAWLGPIKVRMGRMTEDPALVEAGLAVLSQGLTHYPGFVLFSKFLVYADVPRSDPEFQMAVDAVRENTEYCGTLLTGLSADPACNNQPRVSHNLEGAALFLGDMYAKAQDRQAALATYEMARVAPTWDAWDYRDLLMTRIATLDARMAAFASADTADDLEAAWQSQIQCSLCHRD